MGTEPNLTPLTHNKECPQLSEPSPEPLFHLPITKPHFPSGPQGVTVVTPAMTPNNCQPQAAMDGKGKCSQQTNPS